MKRGVFVFVPLYSVSVFVLGASITAGVFVFQVAVAPLIFKYSKTFRRHLVFFNAVQWPVSINYENPSESGVEGARNLSIEYKSKVDNCDITIGIWHILPMSTYEKLKGSFESADKEQLHKLMDEELINSKTPIMMYFHGNSSSRASDHRVKLYKFFQKMDYHTIAFDYRGYGDSTNVTPSEDGVVEDSLIVYDWLQNTIQKSENKPPLYLWGHSLGTGISSHLLGNLPELSKNVLEKSEPLPQPNGLILESPFSCLADEMHYHPIASLVSWLPYFEAAFVTPFKVHKGQQFFSDKHLCRTPTLPILILHARDDVIVPHLIGKKLYKTILESRANGGATIKLHSYDKKEKLGHKWICNAKDLPDVVGDFVTNHQ
ncbi:unnamed protein product, partial [Brenthis ino]